jgi:Immunity protein 26
MARPAYPFVPKSTAYLEAGQFWAIPLTDGRFACGRVLAVPHEKDPNIMVGTRAFLAGLLDWVGDAPPDGDAIAGTRLVAQGFAHIKAIMTTGGVILGIRPLDLDHLVPSRWKSHEAGGTVWVYEGATRLHPISPDERSLPIISVWGYSVIRDLAERSFVGSPWRPEP